MKWKENKEKCTKKCKQKKCKVIQKKIVEKNLPLFYTNILCSLQQVKFGNPKRMKSTREK